MKKVIAVVISLALMVSMFVGLETQSVAATTPSTVNVTQALARIDQLINLMGATPDGLYFTVNRQPCVQGSHSSNCSNCYVANVMATSWLTNLIGMGTLYPDYLPSQYNYDGAKWSNLGWQCFGFANFAHWYIFAQRNTDNLVSTLVTTGYANYSTLSKARPGDVIRTSGHSMVFISCNASNYRVIDCNIKGGGTTGACRVRVRTVSYTGERIGITGVTNYARDDYGPQKGSGYRIDDYSYMVNNCDNTNGWTGSYDTEVTNCENRKEGKASLLSLSRNPAKYHDSGNIGTMSRCEYTYGQNLSSYGFVQFRYYLSHDFVNQPGELELNFCTNNVDDGYNLRIDISNMSQGWHKFTMAKSEIPQVGSGANWSNITNLRWTWWNDCGRTEEVNILLDEILAYNVGEANGYPINDNVFMLHSCDGFNGWRGDFDTRIHIDSEGREGDGCLIFDTDKSTGRDEFGKIGMMGRLNFQNAFDISSYDYISFQYYLSEDMKGRKGELELNFCTDNPDDGYNMRFDISNNTKGWHIIKFSLKSIPKVGESASWSKITNGRFTWWNISDIDPIAIRLDNIIAVKNLSSTYEIDENNYMINDCDSTGGWSGRYDSNVKTSDNKKQGNYSINISTNNPTAHPELGNLAFLGSYQFGCPLDLTEYDYISFDYYLGDDYGDYEGDLELNFNTSSVDDGYDFRFSIQNQKAGWHTAKINRTEIPLIYPSDWSNITNMRFVWWNLGKRNNIQILVDNIVASKDSGKVTPDDLPQLPSFEKLELADFVAVEKGRRIFNQLSAEQKKACAQYEENLFRCENRRDGLEKKFKYGDVNNDNSVNAVDSLTVIQFSVNLIKLDYRPFEAARVNGEKTVDASDALLILQRSLALVDSFPVEK